MSPPLIAEWVFDFDYDQDHIVGFLDYFVFVNDFGTTTERSDATEDGIVGFPDYFKFAKSFGTCSSLNHVKAVPCD